jgi:hypothetical protein
MITNRRMRLMGYRREMAAFRQLWLRVLADIGRVGI